MHLSYKSRKIIRKQANASGTTCPIEVIDGFNSPKLFGTCGHYIRKSRYGHPGYYFMSTKTIFVGIGWLVENQLYKG